MRQKILTLTVCLFVVLGLNAQKRGTSPTINKADNYVLGVAQLAKQGTLNRVYIYTGGESHQGQYKITKELDTLFFEDFESGNLDNFTVINGGDPNGFVADTIIVGFGDDKDTIMCASLTFGKVAHDDWLITPQVTNVKAGTKIQFWAASESDYFQEEFDVIVSKTTAEAASFTDTLAVKVEPPKMTKGGAYYEYDLTPYAGENIYVGIHSTTTDQFRLYLDNFYIYVPADKDLAITSLSNPITLDIKEFIPKAVVENLGSEAQTNFDVEFRIDEADGANVYTSTVTVPSIAVAAQEEVSFDAFTPEDGKSYVFKALVNLTGDEITSNDTLMATDTVQGADLEGLYYAYLTAAQPGMPLGIFAFDIEDSTKFYRISKEEEEDDVSDIFAGDLVDDTWYAYSQKGHSLNTVCFTSGKVTQVAAVDDTVMIADMAYDYAGKKLYVTGLLVDGEDPIYILGSIELGSLGAPEDTIKVDTLVILDNLVWTLACNTAGELYGISTDGKLISIDITNGAIDTVGPTGVTNIKYVQTMAFDRHTDELYWAQMGEGSKSNYKIDVTTGEAELVSNRNELDELTSLVCNTQMIIDTVVFKVTDGTNAIQNAYIQIKNKAYATDNSGLCTIELYSNEFDYVVRKTGFENAEGTFTSSAVDTVEVTMTAGDAKWPVTFTVSNEVALVEGAEIVIDGETVTTNKKGIATIEHVNATDISYSVTADKHDDFTGSLTIADTAVSVAVSLVRTTHNLNFVVKENWGSNKVVDSAQITIACGDSLFMGYTNASGELSFETILEGEYTCNIQKADFVAQDSLVALTADATITVMLDEAIADPYALKVEVPENENKADFTWNNPTGFYDDFESYDNFVLEFGDWTLIDGDGIKTFGFTGIVFENAEEPMAAIIFNPGAANPQLPPAHSGEKFSATFNPNDGSACDDWIISPKTLVIAGDKVSFFASGGNENYSLEKFQVFVSETTPEVASFVEISEIITTDAASTEWKEYSFDIPESYAGKEIYVAIHVTSADQFYFRLDDFKIGNPTKGQKTGMRSVQSYTVSLDGNEKASGLTEAAYQFTDLVYGQTYTAGVKAVYESGETEEQTIEFTVPFPKYEVTFIVKDDTEAAEAVDEAEISIDNKTLTTDADGKAMIELAPGNYDYSVSKDGYADTTGSVTVAEEAVTENVILRKTIANNEINIEALIAPNPTNGLFKVQAEGTYNVKLVDVSGKVVYVAEMNNEAKIDITSQKAGVYFLTLTDNNGNAVTYKIVKK